MDWKQAVHLFHLYRADGSELLLHPFHRRQSLRRVLRSGVPVGLYGAEPEIRTLVSFRDDLYRWIDRDVWDWMSEVRFIPRFLVASGVLLLSYGLLNFTGWASPSQAVGMGIALVPAIVAYAIMAVHDRHLPSAVKQRLELRRAVDAIRFQPHSDLVRLERLLHELESASPHQALSPSEALMPTGFDEPELIREVIRYLEMRFGFRRAERRLRRVHRNRLVKRDTDPRTLVRWAEARKLDIPLFALYRALHHSLGLRETAPT